MKIRYLLMSGLMLTLITDLSAGNIPVDDNYFTSTNEILEAQGRVVKSIADKKANAQAHYALLMKASKTAHLSNAVQLSLAASATEAFGEYMRTIPNPSRELTEFAASSEVLSAIFLLETSLEMLARIPVRQTFLNVSPPAWTPGLVAGGMDPKGITDPKARAEYERRIADNSAATEEVNSRTRMENADEALQDILRVTVVALMSKGKADSCRAAITASQLPEKIKVRILGKGDAQPNTR
ncbi:MAG: hypothetical protein WCG79_10385 [Verrucomicrobiota bacterium]|jgi:hypothetical protein